MWSLRTWSWKPSGVVSRFVRKVRTASGAVAVQVVTRRGRQVEQFEHVGSAHTNAELALLLTAARARVSPGPARPALGRPAHARRSAAARARHWYEQTPRARTARPAGPDA